MQPWCYLIWDCARLMCVIYGRWGIAKNRHFLPQVYSHYMQFYSAPHLQQLGREYPRFLAFMRQVERRKESGRQSLSDLLVRPVQRLPSMLLLIQGMFVSLLVWPSFTDKIGALCPFIPFKEVSHSPLWSICYQRELVKAMLMVEYCETICCFVLCTMIFAI